MKIPNLNIPFCWDEAWVYAPGIKAMAQHGISLLPNGLNDAYSRGHPLLFFYTGAIWVKIFGGSFASLHLFALVIAVCFIFTLFYIVSNIFDSTLALIVCAIMLVQPIFIAQSAITLPEIFFALWALLTIYYFETQDRFYYSLFGSLMLLTKESGVAIIAGLALWQTIIGITLCLTMLYYRYKRIYYSRRGYTQASLVLSDNEKIVNTYTFSIFIQDILLILVPLIPFIIFIFIQHAQRGYYLFPEHIRYISFNWKDVEEKLRYCYDFLFERQGRKIITWSFPIIFGLFYKRIPRKIRWGLVLGLMVCVKPIFSFGALPAWLMIPVMGVFTGVFFYFMHIGYTPNLRKGGRFLSILFITGLVYLVFSSVNFFTNRYIFVLVPLMVLYFSYYTKTSFRLRPFLFYTWAALVFSIMVYVDVVGHNDLGDTSPQYVQGVKLEQTIVKYLEEQHLQKDTIGCNFTMNNALRDTGSGYLSGNLIFVNASCTFDKNTKYAIYTNLDHDTIEWKNGGDSLPHFQLIKTFERGIARGRVFKRI